MTPEEPDLPTVPTTKTGPGRVLQYRLERDEHSASYIFFSVAVGALLYHVGFAAALIYLFDKEVWVAVLLPFVCAGWIVIAGAVYAGVKWVAARLVGRIEIEVSDHPLVPGAPYRLHCAQSGFVILTGVRVTLVCGEEATYAAGTRNSTDRKEVVTWALSDPRQGRIDDPPLAAEFTVPRDAMHSFRAASNTVNWKVRVSGLVLGRYRFTEEYGVAVGPPPVAAGPPPPPRCPAPAWSRPASHPPEVRLWLASASQHPRGELTGAFVIPGGPPDDTRSVELVVLWWTSGKGTEDVGVAYRRAWKADDGTLAELPNPNTFAVPLPPTPWSYDGEIVKVHWTAGVRLRCGPAGRTREVIADVEFVLAPAAVP